MIDVHQLAAEVGRRDGIRVMPGDPAFALVTLNQLVLEDAIKQIGEHIRSGIAEFSESVKKTESLVGKVLAEEVKEAAAEVREELHRDVDAARVGAREILCEIYLSTSRVMRHILFPRTSQAISRPSFTAAVGIGRCAVQCRLASKDPESPVARYAWSIRWSA